jgi:hypothetical protein
LATALECNWLSNRGRLRAPCAGLLDFQKTLRSAFLRKRVETDLDQELRYHLEQEIEDNIRAGMMPEEAKFAAQRLIGPLSLYKEE